MPRLPRAYHANGLNSAMVFRHWHSGYASGRPVDSLSREEPSRAFGIAEIILPPVVRSERFRRIVRIAPLKDEARRRIERESRLGLISFLWSITGMASAKQLFIRLNY